MQVGRITLARGLDEDQRQKLIQLMDDMSEGPQFLVFGQPRINVFKLNLALDSLN
jgi:K+-transporting ATPase ATPase C chain